MIYLTSFVKWIDHLIPLCIFQFLIIWYWTIVEYSKICTIDFDYIKGNTWIPGHYFIGLRHRDPNDDLLHLWNADSADGNSNVNLINDFFYTHDSLLCQLQCVLIHRNNKPKYLLLSLESNTSNVSDLLPFSSQANYVAGSWFCQREDVFATLFWYKKHLRVLEWFVVMLLLHSFETCVGSCKQHDKAEIWVWSP